MLHVTCYMLHVKSFETERLVIEYELVFTYSITNTRTRTNMICDETKFLPSSTSSSTRDIMGVPIILK